MENWRRRGIFFPLLLITAGVLLFLNNLGRLPGSSWDIVLRLWPLLLIVAGLDGFWRGWGYTGATVATGLGVIFLLGNLNYISISPLNLILRLWPLLLVALGLDIILGQRRPWSPLLGILIGLVITAGVYLVVVSAPLTTSLTTQAVNLSLNDASTARGTIVMPVGRMALSGGAEGGNLVSGSVAVIGSETLIKDVTSTGSSTSFRLESRGYRGFMPFNSGSAEQEWKLMLNPAPTYSLDLKLVVGEQLIQLKGLKVTDFKTEVAVGKTHISLPAAGPFTGRVQMAIGQVVISVPRGAPVKIRLERALTVTSQPPDFSVNGRDITSPAYTSGPAIELTVNQAIGSIVVEYEQ